MLSTSLDTQEKKKKDKRNKEKRNQNCSDRITWKYAAFTFGKDKTLALLQAGELVG